MTYFEKLQEAILKLADEKRLSNDNGTQSMKLKCYLYQTDTIGTEALQKLESKLMKAIMNGTSSEVAAINEEIDQLPDKKRCIMHFRLIDPIPQIVGTKQIPDANGKMHSPIMKNVTEFSMAQDYLFNNTVSMEETEETAVNREGSNVPVVILSLDRCVLEVTEPKFYNNKLITPKKAYISAMTTRMMQIIGRMTYGEDNQMKRIERLAD